MLKGLADEWRAQQAQHDSLAKINLVVMALTGLVVFAYTAIAACQLREMRDATRAATLAANEAKRANDDTGKRFQVEQRPYVWLDMRQGENVPAPFTWTVVEGRGRIVFYVQFTNFGRSAANNLTISASMLMGPDAFSKARALPAPKKRPPVPPGGTETLIVPSPLVVDGQGFQRWRSIDRSMVVFGKIAYEDVSGGNYETGFCIYSRPDNKVEYCPDGNYIK